MQAFQGGLQIVIDDERGPSERSCTRFKDAGNEIHRNSTFFPFPVPLITKAPRSVSVGSWYLMSVRVLVEPLFNLLDAGLFALCK